MKSNFKILTRVLLVLLAMLIVLTSCLSSNNSTDGPTIDSSSTSSSTTGSSTTSSSTTGNTGGQPPVTDGFDFSMVPAYSKDVAPDGYVVINDNVPFFDDFPDVVPECIEVYGELDSLGRCTAAYAILGKDLLPSTDKSPSITSVTPTGWHTVEYPETANDSLYNRSHLIAYSLAGEGANPNNLITGTRYFNQHTMQIFESQLLDYIRGNDTHVAYRVTPIFEGNNLVASGVLMEAYSIEDFGASIKFCVFAYNVQEGIIIDYATGSSSQANPTPYYGKTDFDGNIFDLSKFDTTGQSNSYKELRSVAGWSATWARVDEQDWIKSDASTVVAQITLNGNKDKQGTITSAALSGGISEFHMQYGLSFSDKKISFTVEIIQNGKTVASKTVTNTSAEMSKGYELNWVLGTPVEGEFVIKITNNCPSNSKTNTDRLSIWNIGWK